jgi:hypothetical protein
LQGVSPEDFERLRSHSRGGRGGSEERSLPERVSDGGARRLFEASLALDEAVGHRRVVAGALHDLGRLARFEGDLVTARRLQERSLGLSREAGDLAAARVRAEASLAIARALGNEAEVAVRLLEAERIARAAGAAAHTHPAGRADPDPGPAGFASRHRAPAAPRSSGSAT